MILRAKKTKGYRQVVGPDNGELKLLSFGVLVLEPGEHYEGTTGSEEKVLVLLQGQEKVEVEGKVYSGSRQSVFTDCATAVYLPIDTSFTVTNTGNAELEAALAGTPADKRFDSFQITPDDIHPVHRGKDTWQRDVHDIVVRNAEGRVQRIIVGETFNEAGMWSSYPPHKHDHYVPGVEADMEEVYYYKLNPADGFGLQANYTSDQSVDEAYRVQDGDAFLVPKGYHPVCAAGGYQLYYLWMMAGPVNRVMIPNDDSKHAWVKG